MRGGGGRRGRGEGGGRVKDFWFGGEVESLITLTFIDIFLWQRHTGRYLAHTQKKLVNGCL